MFIHSDDGQFPVHGGTDRLGAGELQRPRKNRTVANLFKNRAAANLFHPNKKILSTYLHQCITLGHAATNTCITALYRSYAAACDKGTTLLHMTCTVQ